MLRLRVMLLLCVFAIAVNGQKVIDHKDIAFTNEVYRLKLKRNIVFVLAGSGLAFAFDQSIQKWMLNSQSDFGNDLANVANVFGEKKVIIPALGLTWGAGYLIKDDRLKRTSWNAMKAVAVTAVATEGIKISAGRARPYMDKGPSYFDPFNGSDQYKSLPSGHTSLAFAVFTPFAETYSRWFYVVPVSVAMARMYKNKHWLSDVVLGGGIGFLSGWIFSHHPGNGMQVSANGIIVFF